MHLLTLLPLSDDCDRIIDYRITTDPSTLSKNSSTSIVPGSATVANGVDVSDIGNGGGTAEGFVFDPEIVSYPSTLAGSGHA